MRIITYFLYVFIWNILLGCSAKVNPPSQQNAGLKQANLERQCADKQCPCETSIGTIKHGSKVKVYSIAEVNCGQTCNDKIVELTCQNGKFNPELGNNSYSCTVKECSSCQVGFNLLRHGESNLFYSKNVADCNESCEAFKGVRICNNGVLSGDVRFNEPTCQKRACHCNLPDDTTQISLGGTVKLYNTNKPGCGFKCSDGAFNKMRSCVYNTSTNSFNLNGDPLFKFQKCSDPTGCQCILPGNLGNIFDGELIALTKTPQVNCGSTCAADADINLKCSNGNLVNIVTSQILLPTDLFYVNKGKCSVKPCESCKVTNTISVPHISSYNFYNTSSPTCGSSCNSLSKKCDDGKFTPVNSSYQAATCTLRTCLCQLPDNTSVTLNSSVNWYSKQQASCGESCPNLMKPDSCAETNSNGNYTYNFNNHSGYPYISCAAATGCSCKLPTGDVILDKVTVDLYKVSTVACGQTCSQQPSLKIKCDSGALRNSATDEVVDTKASNFAYKSLCIDPSCPQCNLDNYGPIADGSSLTLYSKDTLNCGDNITLLSSTFKCAGGVLTKNGQPYATDPNIPQWFNSIINACTGCKTPWGATIPFGQTTNFYKTSGSGTVSNPCGKGCKMASRKCLNTGVWDGVEADYVDFTLQACANNCSQEGGGAPPRLCLLPWQNSYVTPDAQIPMWRKRQVKCGDSCQNYFKLGRCDMSTGVFDAGFEYIYQSCTELCP